MLKDSSVHQVRIHIHEEQSLKGNRREGGRGLVCV